MKLHIFLTVLLAFVTTSCDTVVSKTRLSMVSLQPISFKKGESYYVDYEREVSCSRNYITKHGEKKLEVAIQKAMQEGGNNCVGIANAKILFFQCHGYEVSGHPIYKRP